MLGICSSITEINMTFSDNSRLPSQAPASPLSSGHKDSQGDLLHCTVHSSVNLQWSVPFTVYSAQCSWKLYKAPNCSTPDWSCIEALGQPHHSATANQTRLESLPRGQSQLGRNKDKNCRFTIKSHDSDPRVKCWNNLPKTPNNWLVKSKTNMDYVGSATPPHNHHQGKRSPDIQ